MSGGRDNIINNICMVVLPVILIIISIGSTIVVEVKSGHRWAECGQSQEQRNQSYNWCLPCDVLERKDNPALLSKLSRESVGMSQNCFARDAEQVTATLELMSSIRMPDLKYSDADSVSLSNASAHQALTVSTYVSIDEPVFMKENVVLEFGQDIDNRGLEHARNIDVRKSVMIIKYPGLYQVYSSIFFKPIGSKPCKELHKQIWDHNVVLTSSRDTADILHTTHTCCDDCTDNKETSYAGGLFYLQENDRLHVEVSNDGVIRFRLSGSYFGLFMLDSNLSSV